MKAEDVMKALEYCKDRGCNNDCPCWNNDIPQECDCRLNLIHDALTLLREKDAEIERLKRELLTAGKFVDRAVEIASNEMKTYLALQFGTYTDEDTVKVSDVFGLIDKFIDKFVEAKEAEDNGNM